MSVISSPALFMGEDGYQISRSVRLRSSASAYFNRTLTTPTNNKIWTWSGWVKRGILTTGYPALFCAPSGTDELIFGNNDTIQIYWNAWTSYGLQTNAVFRDPSAWYHIVASIDTTQATAANRVKIYVNGVQQTFTGSAYPAQNYTNAFNTAVSHQIGKATGPNYLDGYLTEVNFIDGQALTPSSFGENDSITGVWKPKKYAGTYGTNGFYLNFNDNSNNTAATIGKDSSGNGNNWTPNNISVTTGSTYDSMLDTPTPYADGGNGRGNYSTFNPIDISTNTASNGNLTLTNTSTSYGGCRATMAIPTTGKWYWETVVTAQDGSAGSWIGVGMMVQTVAMNAFVGNTSGVIFYGDRNDASDAIYNGTTLVYQGTTVAFAAGDILQCAYDADSGKFWFGKNNAWWDSSVGTTGNPSAGTNQTLTAAANVYFPFAQLRQAAGTSTVDINFGQRPFTYTPPTGFKALNTQNLPDSTIKNGKLNFDVLTYAGSASSQTISGLNFQPDLIWFKERTTAGIDHFLLDSARSSYGSRLQSNTTAAEAATGAITSISSTGYTLAGGGSNTNDAFGRTYVTWNWKKGATPGFDIVTFTAPATNQSFTVNHSLGVTPSMLLIKRRDSATGGDWWAWHIGLGNNTTDYVALNQTAAKVTAANMWGTLGRSSTAFGVNVPTSCVANGTYVAYLFAEVAGFSKFGSYTGNGSNDGPFVYCGFRPRFILIKQTDSAGNNWFMLDTARSTYNVVGESLLANTSDSTYSYTVDDILSNGFKLRNTGSGINANGGTYIYAAFAENPFKNSLAR